MTRGTTGIPLSVANRKRLTTARKACNLTQAELAARVGIKQNTLCEIELGHKRPSSKVLSAWVASLDLEASTTQKVTIRRKRKVVT